SGYPATPTLVTVNGKEVEISSCLELQSTTGALTLPRMTTLQLDTIVNNGAYVDGMVAYNSDISSMVCLEDGVWVDELSTFASASVTLTQAQILALHATPITLITAPGPGLAISVLKISLVNVFNTTAFAGGGLVSVRYKTSNVNALTSTIDTTFVTAGATSVASLYGQNGGAALDVIAASNISNTAVEITNATGVFTGGNAASKIKISI